MTQKEELKIFRKLMFSINYALISAEMKGDKTGVQNILSEIRTYCYLQTNNSEGWSNEDYENARIESLKRLEKL